MDMTTHLFELLRDPYVWVLMLCALLLGVGVGRRNFWIDTKTPPNKDERGAGAAPQENENLAAPESGTGSTKLGSSSNLSLSDTTDPDPPAPITSPTPPLSAGQSAPGHAPLAPVPEIPTGPDQYSPDTSVPVRTESDAVIQTRTGQNLSTKKLIDPYEKSERAWSASETTRALELYHSGKSIRHIALMMRIDQKQVATHLVRKLFGFQGELNDLENAPRNGKSYTDEELAKMVSYFEAGRPIQDIAAAVERTVLGVGWRMLDRRMV